MRLEQLTFTRFLAAVPIVIFHYGQNVYPFNLPALNIIFSQANIGVSYFFILSGFIMVVAYGNSGKLNPAEYFRNRFARIYPLVVVSVIPFLFAAVFLSGKSSLPDALLNLSTLQAWIPEKALAGNFPLWSITVEIFFYLCFPLLVNRFYSKYSLVKVICVITAIWLVSFFTQQFFIAHYKATGFTSVVSGLLYYFPVLHLNQFLVGNLAGLIFLKRQQTATGRFDLHIIVIVLILLLLLNYKLPVSYHNGFLAIVFAPLVFFLAANTELISKIFKTRLFVFLGEISFGIYMLQVPVFQIIDEIITALRLNLYMSMESQFYFKLSLLIVVASFCYIYIEKPVRERIKAVRLKPVALKTF